MREIKFRAWDKEENEMHFDVGIDEHGIPYKFPHDLDSIDTVSADAADYWPDAELMQFTGLKDKSGKEIYEGDIVKYRKHPQKTKVGEVAFTSYGAFAIKNQNELERERGFWTWTSFNGMNSLEVIGNIYENPELLK